MRKFEKKIFIEYFGRKNILKFTEDKILIYIPEVNIKPDKEHDNAFEYTLKDLTVEITKLYDKELPCRIKLTRRTIDIYEIIESYLKFGEIIYPHPHTESLYITRLNEIYGGCCLGSIFKNVLKEIKQSENTRVNSYLFCQYLKQFLETESKIGGPHMYFKSHFSRVNFTNYFTEEDFMKVLFENGVLKDLEINSNRQLKINLETIKNNLTEKIFKKICAPLPEFYIHKNYNFIVVNKDFISNIDSCINEAKALYPNVNIINEYYKKEDFYCSKEISIDYILNLFIVNEKFKTRLNRLLKYKINSLCQTIQPSMN